MNITLSLYSLQVKNSTLLEDKTKLQVQMEV